MTALELAAACYAGVLACILICEFLPWPRTTRAAAITAIVLVATGGSAWTYAAYFSHSDWPALQTAERNSGGGAKKHHHSGHGKGGEPTEDEEDDADDGAGSSGPMQIIKAASDSVVREAHMLMAFYQNEPSSKLNDGSLIQDCADCPELIVVPAGSTVIGAALDDKLASNAERPAVTRRFWPGFAIGRDSVSEKSFATFLSETGLNETRLAAPNCASVPGAISTAARCVTAALADTYVSWLTTRTGKQFRLATASEWEYAMKTAGEDVARSRVASIAGDATRTGMRAGEVHEIVADCWQDAIPAPDFEMLAVSAETFLCEARMTKGWSQPDGEKWQRASARRRLSSVDNLDDTGLRVVRALY